MDKETPITKYLATLERRQAQRERDFLYGSPSPFGGTSSPPVLNPSLRNIRQQLRFEDETFMQPCEGVEEVQNLSPSSPAKETHPLPSQPRSTFGSRPRPLFPLPSGTNLVTPATRGPFTSGLGTGTGSSFKRKRYSFEEKDEDEDHIKKICELQKLLRQTNGDLVESRAITAKLEKQKMDLRTELQEKSLLYEKSLSDMRMRCREAVDKMESLQKDNEVKSLRLEELKEELRVQSTQGSDKGLTMEGKLLQLQNENIALKQQLEEEKFNQSDVSKKMSDSLNESTRGSEKWSLECQILKEQLELKENQLAKYLQELKEAQSQVFKSVQLSEKFSAVDSTEGRIVTLEEEVKKYENLYIREQSENTKLSKQLAKMAEENGYFRGTMNRELLLQEQVSSLETEVKYLRSVAKNKAEIEVQRDLLDEKLKQWISVAQKIDTKFSSPHNFALFLASMQTDLVQAKHDNASLNFRVDSLNRDINRLQDELNSSKDKVRTTSDDLEKAKDEMKQISRRLLLTTKDRDGLKALKESFESEFETIINTGLTDRIKQLENLISEYEKEEDSSIKRPCKECDQRMSLISELRAQLERTRSQGHEVSSLEDSLLGESLDGNTSGVKVVTFGNNPSALSLEVRVKELCSENEKLKERIRYLENQSVLGPSDTVIEQGNRILEEQIRTLERKNQLLSEDYDYETQQLQTALSKLFGFHVILVKGPQPQFRLQSVNSSGQEDEIIFQEASNGDMMLLETPVLDNFREDINRFLLSEGSIPSFMATVTIAFAQGQLQSSDMSQFPSSQQSTTSTTSGPVTIQPTQESMADVQVDRRHDDDSDDGEEAREDEEDEDKRSEGPYSDYDDDEDDEGEEHMEEEYHEGDEEEEDDDDEEPEPEGADHSDDDVVCIDSD